MKKPIHMLSSLVLAACIAGCATPSAPTANVTPQTPYRYTAVELAEEAIEAYDALGTNDVALAKQILLEAIFNYIEDDERGRSAVTSQTKIDQKARRVRDEFRRIYSELLKSQK